VSHSSSNRTSGLRRPNPSFVRVARHPLRASRNQPLYNHDPDGKLLDARRRTGYSPLTQAGLKGTIPLVDL
jgi:hypothetical protein